jgi:hypothetical protein
MRRELAILSIAVPVALASVGSTEATRPALVYASARLVYEQGGPRVDQVTDLFAVGPDGVR